MAPEVWEVGVLLPRGPSLGERTGLLGGGLLGRLHLATEPVGEPRFQVELASKKHRDGLYGMVYIHVTGIRAKASPRRHWGWELERDSLEELHLGLRVVWQLPVFTRGTVKGGCRFAHTEPQVP